MDFWRRICVVGMFLVALILLLNSAVFADFAPRIEVEAGSGNAPAAVIVNGRTAVRFLVPNGSLSPTRRANITADRLRALAAARADWGVIGTKPGATAISVAAGDKPICVVTKQDAKANKSEQNALARSWAENLKKLLRMPPVELSTTDVLVPFGESRIVQIDGAAFGPVDVECENTEVALLEVTPDNKSLLIHGQAVGDTIVRVMRSGEVVLAAVRVRKYAGRYKEGFPIEVTGEPAPGSLLKALAQQLAYTYIETEPGASIEVGDPKLPVSELHPGTSTVASVPITIVGEPYIPTTFNAPVTLVNRRIQPKPTELLFYSNNPERVLKYGQLYLGNLEPDVATRLLYHHQNGIGKRMRFDVSLMNPHDAPAKIQVISGVSVPNIDTVVVGYSAGSKFLRDYMSQVGYIVTVPARSRLVLYSQMLEPLQTASGIIEFRGIQGRDVALKVTADLPETAFVRRGNLYPMKQGDLMADFSDHVYPSPTRRLEASYVVGDRWAFIGVGKQPLKGLSADNQLFGNYGVIYEINLKLENPTPTKQKINVVFESGAGLASAVFNIDGKFVERKYVKASDEAALATFQLEPRQTKMVSILTLPLSGSFYPANIVVRVG